MSESRVERLKSASGRVSILLLPNTTDNTHAVLCMTWSCPLPHSLTHPSPHLNPLPSPPTLLPCETLDFDPLAPHSDNSISSYLLNLVIHYFFAGFVSVMMFTPGSTTGNIIWIWCEFFKNRSHVHEYEYKEVDVKKWNKSFSAALV